MSSGWEHRGFHLSLRFEEQRYDSAKKANYGPGDSGNDQQQHHHGNGTVLIFVIHRRSEEPIATDGIEKT